MRRRLVNSAAFGSVATLLDAGPARAYLDPGTGSIMLQALLGAGRRRDGRRQAVLAPFAGIRDLVVSGQVRRGRAGEPRPCLLKVRPAG